MLGRWEVGLIMLGIALKPILPRLGLPIALSVAIL